MSNLVKAVINIVKSFGYDLIYAIKEGFYIRAGADNYKNYSINKRYSNHLKFGAALETVKPLALKYCKGRGVDVGASLWPLKGARGIDNSPEENAYKINESSKSLDFVFSSHTLEHLDRPYEALEEWVSKLRQGGVLFLYLPHPGCDMWKPENLKFHKWSPDPVCLEEKLSQEMNMDIVYVTYLPDAYFSFVVVAKKIDA